ncbi:MAG TPA: GTPase Era [Bacteroidales bacterium]|nr:GTPase Era [Bacteroidales bacterium]HPO66312.1 GTPase Era [Bacteroidales bacterium]
MSHKAGYVNILGRPNVGKSTLMNAMLGEKLSIITPKAQTTRHRIIGIDNGDDYQIVFSDTPGIIKPKYKLHQKMMDFVREALTDADILLYLTDVEEKEEDLPPIFEEIQQLSIPLLVGINKVDLSNQSAVTQLVESWKNRLPSAEIFPLSALYNFNVDTLKKRILELLPEHPPYYPKENLSDRNLRFFVSEIIREKILLHYQKEIPYAVEVVIESYKESENLDRISATIYVERETQKGIIIGKGGEALKKIGIEARKDIEALVGKQVYLELYVKVKKDWRNNEKILNQWGYKI